MKNKILLTMFVLISLVLVTGCNKPQEEPNYTEIFNDYLNSIVLPETTSDDIEFPKSINGYDISWSTNREDVISLEGVVTPSFEDVEVTVFAQIAQHGAVVKREFKIFVPKLDPIVEINKVFDQINIPSEVNENIELPEVIDNLKITWSSSNRYVITTRGVVTQGEQDETVVLKATISYKGQTLSKEYSVKVPANPVYVEILTLTKDLTVVSETYENIVLPTHLNGVDITWKSSRTQYLTADGVVTRQVQDYTVTLTATFKYKGEELKKYYDVVIKGWTVEEKLQYVYDSLNFDSVLNNDLILMTEYDYDVLAVWESSNQEVLSNDGSYNYDENVSSVTLKVSLQLGENHMQKEFEFTLKPKEEEVKEHLVIERAEELNSSKFNNVELVNGKLVLTSGSKVGTYESDVIETQNFVSLVASWAAVSSTTATVELEVKVRVGGVWSDYISYYPWGLGLQNACYDQSNSLIKLATDEVMVLNSKRADALMYKVTLRTTADTTPELSLVSFALEIPGYIYNVNISSYPKTLIHEVPLLYQGEVPSIGNSICSATSSTMLLKYKGESFKQFDSEYEHRYMASIVRDYGNKIYGNWVYNTVAMSGYGYDSYVARFYSINELVKHLATVGPCALSVKGQMTSDIKNYYTGGHLIVAIGYSIDENGSISIICNDPNVKGSSCVYSMTVINNTWRNIAYIIE